MTAEDVIDEAARTTAEVLVDDDDDYAPPFEKRSFGGEFVWADAPGFTAKILRVRPGEIVIVSTRGRTDMVAMLSGGRGVLEVRDGDNIDRVELMPACPVQIEHGPDYRLIAVTDVELMTIYSVAPKE